MILHRQNTRLKKSGEQIVRVLQTEHYCLALKNLMNNWREDKEHTMHKDELATDSKLDKMYSCLHTKQKLIQPML